MKKFKKLFAALMAAAMMMALCVVGASAVSKSSLEVDGKTLEAVDKSTTTFNDLQAAHEAGTLYYSRDSKADKDYSRFTEVTESANGQKWYFYEPSGQFNLYGVKADLLGTPSYESQVPSDMNLYILKDNSSGSEEPGNEDPTPSTAGKITIKKTVESAVAADNTFNFTVKADTNNQYTSAWDNKAVSITTENGEGSTELDLADFENAHLGYYKFTITETPVSGYSMTNPTANYTLVVNKFKNNDGSITTEANLQKDGAGEKLDSADFVNKYTTEQNLTVQKKVVNPQYEDVNAEYEITVTLTKKDTDTVNTLPSTIDAERVSGENTTTETVSGTVTGNTATYTFKLKADETLKLTKIPGGVEYKVEEDTSKINNKYFQKDKVTIENGEGTLDKDVTATVTNPYEEKSATGLATRIAPFVAMAVLAGGAVAAYFVVARKRQENE